MQTTIKGLRLWCYTLAGSAGLALLPINSAVAQEDTRVNGFYENATYGRDGVGLSKFRNTLQLEAEKRAGDVGIFVMSPSTPRSVVAMTVFTTLMMTNTAAMPVDRSAWKTGQRDPTPPCPTVAA